jgi:hypothetical protein
VVSLTSSGDEATGLWFQVGTSLAATSKAFDKVGVPGPGEIKESEKLFYTSTPGHNRLLINHETEDLHKEIANSQGNTAFEVNLSRRSGTDVLDRYAFVTPVNQSNSGPLKLWQFKRIGRVDVPYWDVQVSPEIIRNHGDIWNDKAQAMMAAIFRMNFPLPLKPVLAAPSKVSVPKPNLQREPDFRRLY